MLEFKIKTTGIDEVIKRLDNIQKNEVPFATARALTKTGQEVKEALIKEMESKFDRPTPYTLNSLMLRPATKQTLAAFVWLRDFAGKGTPAVKYLWAQVSGGQRRFKRFEVALQRIGVLPQGMYIAPGEGADRDSYGNLSRGQIVQVLAYFKAFGEQGYKANMNEKGRARLAKGSKKKGTRGIAYFVAGKTPRTAHLAPGIYKRVGFSFGSAIKPVFMFVKAPQYSKRFKFYEVSEKVVHSRFVTNFKQALADALNSMKR